MRINNKCKIATIALIRLAELKDQRPVSLPELASIQGQSSSYLEQIFAKLMKAGLVKSVRGPGGGYVVKSLKISVSDIVNAINKDDRKSDDHIKWVEIGNRVNDEFKKITLADLIL